MTDLLSSLVKVLFTFILFNFYGKLTNPIYITKTKKVDPCLVFLFVFKF